MVKNKGPALHLPTLSRNIWSVCETKRLLQTSVDKSLALANNLIPEITDGIEPNT